MTARKDQQRQTLILQSDAAKNVISQSCAIYNTSPNAVLTSNCVSYSNGLAVSLDIIEYAIKWILKNEDADTFPASFVNELIKENSQSSTINNPVPVAEPTQSVFHTDPV